MSYYKDANKAVAWGWLQVIIAVVIVGAIGAGIWGLTVLLSGPKGQGDAIVENNSSDNWVAAQAFFEETYQDILATDQKIDLAYDVLQGDPESTTAKTNYQGLVSYCLNIVADYNAKAREYLYEDWKAIDLPDHIDSTLPTTDCKEND